MADNPLPSSHTDPSAASPAAPPRAAEERVTSAPPAPRPPAPAGGLGTALLAQGAGVRRQPPGCSPR
ncbi:MAG: hypothetical protein U0736_09735 [Gemmataceae bacterium]